MPVNEEIDENQLEEYIEKGGLNPKTIAKRKRVVDGFHRYVSGKEKQVAALLMQPEELEEALIITIRSFSIHLKMWTRRHFEKTQESFLVVNEK